jgi:hypothetical protein
MSGYLIESPSGRCFAAHADGTVTIFAKDVTHLLSPDDVETLREVLRLAGALHGRARRKACQQAYDEEFQTEDRP